jgi:hypothetical protein
MSQHETDIPFACNPQALAPEDWAAHQATTHRLFGQLREASEELPDGYAFRFPASAFGDVAAFVEGERRCCPFLAFTIAVAPGETTVTLRLTGSPEAKAIVAAELINARL